MRKTSRFFHLVMLAILVLALLPVQSAFAQTPADSVGPVTSGVSLTPAVVELNDMVTLTALVDDTATGASLIKLAEYSLNNAAWMPMLAVDGNYDGVMENVTASFKVTLAGQNQVCVRGTDVADAVGAPVCASVAAQYVFKGFFSPIKMGKDNKVNAPRTIPIKWNLKDGRGKAISDKSSFVALKSYAVDCTTLVGDPTTAVVEKGPGKSGLKYHGKGSWSYNWKTVKEYRGTCRVMFVEFKDGQQSPMVLFLFK